MRPIVMLLLVLSLAGCSYRAAYENIQINQRTECMKGPQSEYEDCMARAEKTYEQYEEERQEYLQQRDSQMNR